MIYAAYQAYQDMMAPARLMAGMTAKTLRRLSLNQLRWGGMP